VTRHTILRLSFSVTVVFSVVAPRIEAQNCRKGIPCGNSCISASKVCHRGRHRPQLGGASSPARRTPEHSTIVSLARDTGR
jgi:hypothetical protein